MLVAKENIHSIIPQRPPIVMVDGLIHSDSIVTRCSLLVENDNIFVENSFLQEAGLIENIAQTAAAGTGFVAQQSGAPAPVGFIGAVQNLEIFGLPIVGDVLETEVTVTNQVFDVTFISGLVRSNGVLLAKCDMKIFIPKQA